MSASGSLNITEPVDNRRHVETLVDLKPYRPAAKRVANKAARLDGDDHPAMVDVAAAIATAVGADDEDDGGDDWLADELSKNLEISGEDMSHKDAAKAIALLESGKIDISGLPDVPRDDAAEIDAVINAAMERELTIEDTNMDGALGAWQTNAANGIRLLLARASASEAYHGQLGSDNGQQMSIVVDLSIPEPKPVYVHWHDARTRYGVEIRVEEDTDGVWKAKWSTSWVHASKTFDNISIVHHAIGITARRGRPFWPTIPDDVRILHRMWCAGLGHAMELP